MSERDNDTKAHRLFTVIDEMLRVSKCFETLFADLEGAKNMSTLQKLVLTAVLDAPAPLTVPQIGRNLGNPRQVVQRIVNELEEMGLVRRTENPHHRRASLFLPTDDAFAMRRQAATRARTIARDVLGGFGADQCEQLARELRALRQTIESHSQGPGVSETARVTVSVSRAIALL